MTSPLVYIIQPPMEPTELPVTEKVLETRDLVKGVIYCIEHRDSDKQYIGQTVTHRLNKGKYRPYGIRRRFAEHCSNAIRNTKPSQSSALYNAIREHGPDAFTIDELEQCDIAMLDDRERYWINAQCSLYPSGYNLTTGGARAFETVANIETPPRNKPQSRGGCSHRTDETRARMSASVKAAMNTPAARKQRSSAATNQHNAQKVTRFAGITIDTTNLDQYITVRQTGVIVKVAGQEARFTGKTETQEQLIERAKQFLLSLSTNKIEQTAEE